MFSHKHTCFITYDQLIILYYFSIVFSQSLSELDLIEHFLKKTATDDTWTKKMDYHRLDGTVPTEDRSIICDQFNDTSNKRLR